jgi:hypothetical protein
MRGYDFTIIPKHKIPIHSYKRQSLYDGGTFAKSEGPIGFARNKNRAALLLRTWQTYRDEAAKEDAV